jgi:glycerol-3-phosphate acyltransferase PlsX
MGGDVGPSVTVAALLASLRKNPVASALLFGDRPRLVAELRGCKDLLVLNRIEVRHCDLAVLDEDKPSSVLRHKQTSSMSLAIKAVADGEAMACVSSGNTGALMALGMAHLKTLPGIARPAICGTFPTARGRSYVLDLGANLDCSPKQLAQFALLGSLTVTALEGIDEPTVRLLNVGAEQNKGGRALGLTERLLANEPLLNYQGFVEGDGIFNGDADVVVCDGFSGNVALKASEGVARLIKVMAKELFATSWLTRFAAMLLRGPFSRLQFKLDPSSYNGAYLLGLNGVVVKSHGGATEAGFTQALDVTIEAAKHKLPSLLLPILKQKLVSDKKKGAL